jgi:hypothetical protein
VNEPTRLIVPEFHERQAVSADPMLALFERAARDPTVDVDKMKQLFVLRKEIIDEENKRLFNAAMNAAQAEMSPIAVNMTNPQTHSKYASYNQLDRAIRPIYTKHGFSISFDEGDSPKADHVRVLGIVAHSSGYERTYHRDMPADGKGAKGGDVMTKTHATAAADSYGKRYILKGVFNLAVGEDDKDGNGDEPTIGPGQLATLEQLIADVKADVPKLCRMLKINTLLDIRVGAFETVKAIIEAKRVK